ncbi:hypothetical protein WH47_04809 [Habropoda laboriosa]|uniref:Histone-lysine N-methyltransferase SETMAR n=1 Tax=Habropoda laboriosa TaxID=597456 RepID=A0A0L7QVR1_9HYME|nr:hypothetical protein WH47_04809 [Habropoda laboriosa]
MVLPHSSYSPDLVSSDFFCFNSSFNNNEKVKINVQNCLKQRNKEFFAVGINKLVE